MEIAAETDVSLAGLTLTGGAATYFGGGIYNFGTLTLTNSVIGENSAPGKGGGVFNFDFGTVALTNSTVRENLAGFSGGGVWNSGNSTVTLTDAIICGNTPDQIEGDYADGGGNIIADECSPCVPADFDGDRVTICHVPPGNAGNTHTLTVSINALPAHLAHGDQCGPCEDELSAQRGGGKKLGSHNGARSFGRTSVAPRP